MKLLIKLILFFNIIVLSFGNNIQSLKTGTSKLQNWTGDYSILVIRAEFVEDSNPETTGNGLFHIRSINDTKPKEYDYYTLFDKIDKNSNFILNENKNNKAFEYYDIKEYFSEISLNKFNIHNIDMTRILKLDKKMIEYGENDNLGKLAIDILEKYSNSDINYNLNTYDFIILLHAGYGEEFDIAGDTTGDIISGAVFSEDLKNYGLGSYNFNNDFNIKNDGVMILPESEKQDIKENDYPQSLLGPSVFTFCSFLGMDQLIDGTQETSGVGFWGLMGWGWISYSGHLPTHPLGFQKVKMGWIDNYMNINSSGNYSLKTQNIYRLKAGEREEFLMEYYNLDNKNESGINSFTYLLNFDKNIVIDGQKYHNMVESNISSNRAGLLIYHLDRNKIDYFQKYNLPLIMGKNNKGIDIEEADGMNDLDKALGNTGSFGDIHDLYKENAYFTSRTKPNTDTFNDKKSFINITNIEEVNEEIHLTVDNSRLDYYPKYNENIDIVDKGLYAENYDSNAILYKNNNQQIYNFENEKILFIKEELIITDYTIYKYSENQLDELESFSSKNQNIISNGEYIVINNSDNKSYVYQYNNSTLTFIIEYEFMIDSFFTLNSYYYLKNGSLFKNNSQYLNEIIDYCINNKTAYCLTENSLWKIKNNKKEKIFKIDKKLNKLTVLDYDNDTTMEYIITNSDKILIYNKKGQIENELKFKNIKYHNLLLNNDKIYLLVVTDKVILYNLSDRKYQYFVGKEINKIKLRENSLIYGNDTTYYSFKNDNYKFMKSGNYTRDISLKNIQIEKEKIYLYPNPTSKNYIKLYYNNENNYDTCSIKIYNSAMNKIKENQIELINGDNSIKIKTNGLKIGTYMLYYETDGYSKYLKFSKTK